MSKGTTWLKQLSMTKKVLLGLGTIIVLSAAAGSNPKQANLTSTPTASTTPSKSMSNPPQPTKSQKSTVVTSDSSSNQSASPAASDTTASSSPAQEPSCDPNYTGACVPDVYPSDVDCAGGSGNGPYYVQGPVHVVGTDRYGLDRDGDGIGCE